TRSAALKFLARSTRATIDPIKCPPNSANSTKPTSWMVACISGVTFCQYVCSSSRMFPSARNRNGTLKKRRSVGSEGGSKTGSHPSVSQKEEKSSRASASPRLWDFGFGICFGIRILSFGFSSRCRLDDRRHRAFTALDERVWPESMDLVAFQLGVLFGGREQDDAPGLVNLLGHLEALFHRIAEKLLEHHHHVLVAMIVVVEQDDVISRLALGLLLFLFLDSSRGAWQRDRVTHGFHPRSL